MSVLQVDELEGIQCRFDLVKALFPGAIDPNELRAKMSILAREAGPSVRSPGWSRMMRLMVLIDGHAGGCGGDGVVSACGSVMQAS
jgi:hypothetical protein